MNENVKKQLSSYKRSIENKQFQSSAYTIILIFTIIVFDIFGLQSLVDITVRRFDTLENMNKLIKDLEFKRDNTELLKQKLNDSKYYLNMLEESVPKERKVEKYMVSLVQVAAKHGYKQDKLVIRETRENYVEVRASFKGSTAQLEPFISAIEDQVRLLLVQSIHYSIVENTVDLQVVLRIFYLSR